MSKFDDYKKQLEKTAAQLKTQRDELKVQLNLGKAEARQEWQQLEDKWENFQFKSGKVFNEMGQTSDEVLETLKILGSELKDGYKRIRESIR